MDDVVPVQVAQPIERLAQDARDRRLLKAARAQLRHDLAAASGVQLQHEPELASRQCNHGGAPLDWLLARSANFESSKSVEELAGLLVEHGADAGSFRVGALRR